MPIESLTAGLDDSPYLPTFLRLLLALAIGLFVGMEREHRRKEAGLRTFAFASLLGAVGGLLGDNYSLTALGLAGVLVVLLNVQTIRSGDGAEITTSAALLLTTFVGVLAGQGQTFAPTVLGVTTAALLAWKTPLAGFSTALTESELRSAVMLAIMAFVVYPVLPPGDIDPYGYIDARQAWIIVILISALGFANYVLLKMYGTRGLAVASFLGGLVNSTATVAEVARRGNESPDGGGGRFVQRGVLIALGAMLLRNSVILGAIAPLALLRAAAPLALMFGATLLLVYLSARSDKGDKGHDGTDDRTVTLTSPFSVTSALKFGAILLAITVGATFAGQLLGNSGVYAVSAIGGLISSASATASAATLMNSGGLSAAGAATAAIIASITSTLVTVPLVYRILEDSSERRPITLRIIAVCLIGAFGAFLQEQF